MKKILIISQTSQSGLNGLQMMEIVNILGGKDLEISTKKEAGQVEYYDIERADKIMELQSGISYELNQLKVGKTFKVLFDRAEGDYFIGRTEFDSPDVDNEVLVKKSDGYIRIGDFSDVLITSADHYDLYGKIVL